MNAPGSFADRCESAVMTVKALRGVIQLWAEEDIRQQRVLEEVGGPLSKINLEERERHYAGVWTDALKQGRKMHGADAIAYALVVLDLTHFGK